VPVTLTWQQIALRLLLAVIASFLIGFDRDEHGKTTGIRTTMLVCLAATLAMLQANLLMGTTGKAHDSFVVLDLMRNPLGILTGMGFLGAGAILRKDGLVHGLTTAATLWYVTVLGLLFGGGQIKTASAATVIALLVLWLLKKIENRLTTERAGTLYLELTEDPADPNSGEDSLRAVFNKAGFKISQWNPLYRGSALSSLTCELRWTCKGHTEPYTPAAIQALATSPHITTFTWKV
jgi:putative Mg2+ transporter-C (MgtC) family protein